MEVSTGWFTFPTPAQLDAVHDAEITKCAAFLAHVIRDRLSQERTGARPIGLVLQPKDAPVEDRYPISVMLDAVERLSNDLHVAGWEASAEPAKSSDGIIITLKPLTT